MLIINSSVFKVLLSFNQGEELGIDRVDIETVKLAGWFTQPGLYYMLNFYVTYNFI
jgi:hypothetical protein